jgi:outer membrane protein OmpA-like peptidoglycan-associated protein
MRGRLLLLALLSITGAVGLVASGTVKLPNLPWNIASLDSVPSAPRPPGLDKQSKSDPQKAIEETTAALGIDAQGGAGDPASKPVLDVSRISPNGTSVFAGRAAPNSYVTILEDGKPAGTVKADDSGSWSLSTDHKFASLDPKLTFRADTNPPPAPAPAQTASIAPPSSAKATASPTQEVMKKFEGLVAEAREHAKSAAEVKSSEAQSAPTPGTVGASATAGSDVQMHDAIPVPIMFVYNEAELTSEGQRAVALLLEYVKLERLPSIELSGHADERGTDDYNLDLSRERLETVERILREGGYDGQLKLSPKGKTEPFMGVDRNKYAQEALYQLDRRVELHIMR